MREIKFRAWDNVEDKMYYTGEESDIFFSFNSNGIVATKIQDEPLEEIDSLDHLIYMQYTETKDKNGTDIYEGDIVEYFKNEFAEIKFNEGVFYIESKSEIEFISDIKAHMKVVGNIYNDKKLLTK